MCLNLLNFPKFLLEEAGNAILDVITGAYNPAGRLVVTWYTGNEQLPPMVNYSMVNRTYRYMVAKPQFYFGYGLSYTTFEYSALSVSPASVKPCGTVVVTFSVQNSGKLAGDEVSQVYVSFQVSTYSTYTCPVKLVLLGVSTGSVVTSGSGQHIHC